MLQRVLDAQGNVLLYCHSPARQERDRAIDSGLGSGLEAALAKLQASLSKPKGKAVKSTDMATFMQRLGRAKQRFARAAQHDEIPVATDDSGECVSAITWVKRIKPGSAADLWRTDPGVYCLRTRLDGSGQRHAVAHLHHAHRTGVGVPLTQDRPRSVPGVAPHRSPRRRCMCARPHAQSPGIKRRAPSSSSSPTRVAPIACSSEAVARAACATGSAQRRSAIRAAIAL